MQEVPDLHQNVNVFNNIITELATLKVKFDDEDKSIILLCSLPNFYDHLLTTLTYGKVTITLYVINLHFCLILKEDNV